MAGWFGEAGWVSRMLCVLVSRTTVINLLILGCHLRWWKLPTSVMVLHTGVHDSHWHDINVISWVYLRLRLARRGRWHQHFGWRAVLLLLFRIHSVDRRGTRESRSDFIKCPPWLDYLVSPLKPFEHYTKLALGSHYLQAFRSFSCTHWAEHMTLGRNNDFPHRRTILGVAFSLSHSLYSEWRQRIFRYHNFPSSRRWFHIERYLFRLLLDESFFSGFGARKYWKYSVSLPFPMSSSDTFRKPEYFLPSSDSRPNLFSFLAFLTFFHNFQGNTLRTHIRHDSFLLSRLLHIIGAFYFIFGKLGNFFRWRQKRASEIGNEKRGLSDFDFGTQSGRLWHS